MYPSSLQTNLRRCEGAYVQTSLARAFPHNGQTGLSPVARSTFPRNKPSVVSHQPSGRAGLPVVNPPWHDIVPDVDDELSRDAGSVTVIVVVVPHNRISV